jgi:peptidyl-tRNA hydrolase
MGLGFLTSALAHAAVLLVVLIVLASPRQIESAPSQPVAVDLVSENEVAEAAKDAPKLDLPQDMHADKGSRDAPTQESVRTTQGQALAAPPTPPPQDPFAPGATPQPVYFPMLMQGLESADMGFSFDAPADTPARLSRDEIRALQVHVQKCWKASPRLAQAQKVRVVLRIALDPQGAMTAEPILVKASASSLGPPLVETATQALQRCQPFGFLPAEKYDEWKVLELTFAPQGLSVE